ncbi:RING finger protein [Endozoicomonas euniceicola]|uniref:RING finger protein n=1 Tax=Endozoicomonas euniceicola TaxID=1234143 RepID=A0ABY6H086_9GAMM|nr:RING finger protein [Endozoicomonas euniceicola]UYM17653.1 RING finger protein [Endozoicomonas euniceicola]
MLLINRKVLTFLVLLFLLTVTLFSEGDEGEFQTENNRNVPGYLSSIAGGLQEAANWVFDYYRPGGELYEIKYLSLIAVFIVEYGIHGWHSNANSKSNNVLAIAIWGSKPIVLMYDFITKWGEPEYNPELSWNYKEDLLFFELNPNLLSKHHAYHNLSEQSGLNILKIAVVDMDGTYHAVVKYQNSHKTDHKAVNLEFDESLSNIQFLEPNCVSGKRYDADNVSLLSVFSEEVIHQVFAGVEESVNELNLEPSFTKGKHYFVGTEITARRLEMNDMNGNNTFAVCFKQFRVADVLTKPFNNSNDVLTDEAMIRSAQTQTVSFFHAFTVAIFRQIVHHLLGEVLAKTIRYAFSEVCPICLAQLSLRSIKVAKCGRHWFCASCWNSYLSSGFDKCPMCRQ